MRRSVPNCTAVAVTLKSFILMCSEHTNCYQPHSLKTCFPPRSQQVNEGRLVKRLRGGTMVRQKSCLGLLWARSSSGATRWLPNSDFLPHQDVKTSTSSFKPSRNGEGLPSPARTLPAGRTALRQAQVGAEETGWCAAGDWGAPER